MKRIYDLSSIVLKTNLFIATLLLIVPLTHAEQRVYLERGGALPTEVSSVDYRADKGTTVWTARNIYRSEVARYALFEKQADSWWQIAVETERGRTVDMSMVDSTWNVCIRIRRTVNYPITICMFAQTTAEGVQLSTSQLPVDGEWHTLVLPLRGMRALPNFAQPYGGSIVRIHSDLGYAGDVVGIDYCYLSSEATALDEGNVLPQKRYYMVTNAATPLQTNYEVVDYSGVLEQHDSGWMQWSYIPFPYLSQTQTTTDVLQLVSSSPVPMLDVTSNWCMIAQVRTSMQGELDGVLYIDENKAYTFRLTADMLVRDNETWNRVYIPLDEMTLSAPQAATSVICSLRGEQGSGEWAIGSLMLTNEHDADDPTPIVPADPRNEQRIYWLNDGSPLPQQITCTDYRLDATTALRATYNNCQRSTTPAMLTLLPTNGWWSTDLAANQPIDMSMVNESWRVHVRLRTTSSYRPVNMIFYRAANAELKRYQLTETLLTVAQNGEWKEYDIPMTDIVGQVGTLPQYAASNRVFSLHSDGGGAAGVEVAIDYLYFSHEGASMPDPQPGLAPIDEPELTAMAEGVPSMWVENDAVRKVVIDGRLYIYRAGRLYDMLGGSLCR